MNNYHEIANSPGMWLVSSPIIFVVLFQTIKITLISFKTGRQIGLTKDKMFLAFRAGITTAIIPSIAILLGLVVLMPSLGLPFSWMRLSVVGSMQYELIASGAAAKEMGLDNIVKDPSGIAFSNAVWAMSMGVIFHLFIVAFFTPKIKSLKEKVGGGDGVWMSILTFAAFFGAVSYMVAQPIVKGGAPLIALGGGFVCMLLLGIVITKGKQDWLKEWALAISILAGMTCAGLAYHYFQVGG